MRRYVGIAVLAAILVVTGCGAPAGGSSNQAKQDSAPAAAGMKMREAPSGEAPKEEAPLAAAVPPAAAPTPAAPAGDGGDVRLGSIPMDVAKLKQLQAEVDQGHKAANLDPVSVAIEASATLGFGPEDELRLDYQVAQGNGSGTGEAYVDVLHAGREYLVQLIQPVKSGPGGIWAVNSVRDVGLQADNKAKMAVLQRYFQALADKDYTTAYSLLARRFRQGTTPESLANNSIEAVEGVTRASWDSLGRDELVVDIKLHLSADNRSAWGDGVNTRWASFVYEDDGWRIAGLASSP